MTAAILLQAAGGMATGQIITMVLIIVVFYFFMIRPQVKKQKDQKKYVEELKKGSRVVTNAGIHGRIIDLNDTTFLIEIENGKMRVDKAAISLDASKALNAPVVVAEAKA